MSDNVATAPIAPPENLLQSFGIVLLLLGLAGMAGAFLFPVVADPDALEPIVNANLVALRSMANASGGFVAVCGAVLLAAGFLKSESG